MYKRKIESEKKIEAAEAYQREEGSAREIMKRLKISKSVFQAWVRNHNTFGQNGLPDKAKAKHYPKEVKTAAVQEYWKRLSGLPISSSLSKHNAGCIKKTRIPFFEILADWFCYFDCLLDGEQFTFPESCSSLYVYGLSRSADLLLPHSFAVVVARFPIARFAADGVEDIPAEEQHDIQQAEHDGHPRGCAADDEIIQI